MCVYIYVLYIYKHICIYVKILQSIKRGIKIPQEWETFVVKGLATSIGNS